MGFTDMRELYKQRREREGGERPSIVGAEAAAYQALIESDTKRVEKWKNRFWRG